METCFLKVQITYSDFQSLLYIRCRRLVLAVYSKYILNCSKIKIPAELSVSSDLWVSLFFRQRVNRYIIHLI